MEYVFGGFIVLIAIVGVFIINKISAIATEIRQEIKLENTTTTQKESYIQNSTEEDYVSKIEIEILFKLYHELVQNRQLDIKNNQLEFDNLKKTIDNISNKQTNTNYSQIKDTKDLLSNREQLKYSHLNN